MNELVARRSLLELGKASSSIASLIARSTRSGTRRTTKGSIGTTSPSASTSSAALAVDIEAGGAAASTWSAPP
jgi:hypothetical protein